MSIPFGEWAPRSYGMGTGWGIVIIFLAAAVMLSLIVLAGMEVPYKLSSIMPFYVNYYFIEMLHLSLLVASCAVAWAGTIWGWREAFMGWDKANAMLRIASALIVPLAILGSLLWTMFTGAWYMYFNSFYYIDGRLACCISGLY